MYFIYILLVMNDVNFVRHEKLYFFHKLFVLY